MAMERAANMARDCTGWVSPTAEAQRDSNMIEI
jgi:hypothetical protein